MADRRCLHRKVVESDQFYSLPEAAQALYTHLYMNADDDGFVNCAGSIATRLKGGKAALKRLVDDGHLLKFGEIYVIKDWRVGNSLKSDRLKPPAYPDIAAAVWIKPNREYSGAEIAGCITLADLKNGIHLDSKMDSQKKRIEKNRKELNRKEENRSADGGFDSFEKLWNFYPEYRRGPEDMARVAYTAEIITELDHDQAMASLNAWKASEQWNKGYVPYLHNWLERGEWKIMPGSMYSSVPTGASGVLGEAEMEAIQRILREG